MQVERLEPRTSRNQSSHNMLSQRSYTILSRHLFQKLRKLTKDPTKYIMPYHEAQFSSLKQGVIRDYNLDHEIYTLYEELGAYCIYILV